MGLAAGAALGHRLAGTPASYFGWTAAAYGERMSAAGTWLVVKAFSADAGGAKPPSAPWPARRCDSTLLDPFDHAAEAGSWPAATSACRTIASASGSLDRKST